LQAIAIKLGYSKSAVYRATRGIEIDTRPEANRRRAAIPPPWLQQARRMFARGINRHAIATELGVPKSVVYRWLAR
jgi:transposase